MTPEFLQSPPGQEPVTTTGVFAASPSRVFKAWTDSQELKQWFGPKPNSILSADVDLRVGGCWCFVISKTDELTHQLEGEYEQIDPDTTLVFTWSHVKISATGDREATPYSRVQIDFTPVNDGTRVDLKHESIQQEDGRLGVRKGWHACYTNLYSLLESLRG